MHVYIKEMPVMLAERSKACTVFFARSEAGITLRAWTFGVGVCLCVFFCVCVQTEAL
jgi:hypothetical protein